MKKIKITYRVDNEDWSDGQFEDEPYRTLIISLDTIKLLIEDELNKGEFLSEIENIEIEK